MDQPKRSGKFRCPYCDSEFYHDYTNDTIIRCPACGAPNPTEIYDTVETKEVVEVDGEEVEETVEAGRPVEGGEPGSKGNYDND